jgi:hypothetical protein
VKVVFRTLIKTKKAFNRISLNLCTFNPLALNIKSYRILHPSHQRRTTETSFFIQIFLTVFRGKLSAHNTVINWLLVNWFIKIFTASSSTIYPTVHHTNMLALLEIVTSIFLEVARQVLRIRILAYPVLYSLGQNPVLVPDP